MFLLPLGIVSYPGAISWLTINHGHYYQYPVYEGVMGGVFFASYACLRYFKNDKGQSVAERGIDEVKVTQKKKSGLRVLALVGIVNTLMLILFSIPVQFFALHADPWPQDVVKRSYLTDGFCGPGTTYACPGPAIPIPRPDSAHVSTDGKLVVPAGTELPPPPEAP
jgi:hypothetical protein